LDERAEPIRCNCDSFSKAVIADDSTNCRMKILFNPFFLGEYVANCG
jgi:hypothetical protein